jgi:hypothetical protein
MLAAVTRPLVVLTVIVPFIVSALVKVPLTLNVTTAALAFAIPNKQSSSAVAPLAAMEFTRIIVLEVRSIKSP